LEDGVQKYMFSVDRKCVESVQHTSVGMRSFEEQCELSASVAWAPFTVPCTLRHVSTVFPKCDSDPPETIVLAREKTVPC